MLLMWRLAQWICGCVTADLGSNGRESPLLGYQLYMDWNGWYHCWFGYATSSCLFNICSCQQLVVDADFTVLTRVICMSCWYTRVFSWECFRLVYILKLYYSVRMIGSSVFHSQLIVWFQNTNISCILRTGFSNFVFPLL